MLSNTTYSNEKMYQNLIESTTYLSEKFEVGPDEVLTKPLIDIEFPRVLMLI